jgi:fused signal recognition particle receptor
MARSETGSRWFSGLTRTREALRQRFLSLFGVGTTGRDLPATLDGFEEALLLADVGPSVCSALVDKVRARFNSAPPVEDSFPVCRSFFLEEMAALLQHPSGAGNEWPDSPPAVLFFIGSHGVGKTTTVGRLAHRLRKQGKKVLVAGTDTHRAAAGDQVGIWAERAGVDLVTQVEGADAAAVIHDALGAAVSRRSDVVLVDTAGRLHTERNPMEDLKKIFRVAGRVLPGAPHQNFLVVDATTGQNGLRQAEDFRGIAPITGVVLTKLDGTAKGGIALSIRHDFDIPIRLVGVGEGPDDLIDFDTKGYLNALLPSDPAVADSSERRDG